MLFSYKNFTLSYLSNTTRNRKDINGLRAIAVLMVIFFHAFPNQIKGGFIGVDIFFVISGFLISSTIFSGLENNKFDFFGECSFNCVTSLLI